MIVYWDVTISQLPNNTEATTVFLYFRNQPRKPSLTDSWADRPLTTPPLCVPLCKPSKNRDSSAELLSLSAAVNCLASLQMEATSSVLGQKPFLQSFLSRHSQSQRCKPAQCAHTSAKRLQSQIIHLFHVGSVRGTHFCPDC